jgi:6-phosphogluconolactonase
MNTIKGSRKRLEKKAVSLIVKKIKSTLKTRSYATIGIPGGTSVKNIFRLLSRSSLPFEKIHFFLVDERSVPISSPQSNYNLAKKYFKKNLHPYNYKLSCSSYIKDFLAHNKYFDLILLSAGEDGHVASLFPNHPSILNNSKLFISVKNSPKPPKSRISASLCLLQRSKSSILLFFGKNKSQALENFNNKKLKLKDCPAKLVSAIRDSYVLTDIT